MDAEIRMHTKPGDEPCEEMGVLHDFQPTATTKLVRDRNGFIQHLRVLICTLCGAVTYRTLTKGA